MSFLVVVNHSKDWPLDLPAGGEVVDARTYLTDENFSTLREVRVFNLCRSLAYQSTGYYVSLLAAARGHRVLPTLETVHDLRSVAVVRSRVEDAVDELLQDSLEGVTADVLALGIYFGRTPDRRYARLADRLFAQYPAPFLRADLERREGRWRIGRLRLIGAKEIPADDRGFVLTAANAFFARRSAPAERRTVGHAFDLAILHDPAASEAPSDPPALDLFCEAARERGIRPELITRDDLSRLPSFDALFIRETTRVNHHTYRFAVRAAAEGLVVIDDPQSILRCTNKVYLKEMLERHQVRIPRTQIVHRGNAGTVGAALGFPLVLKQPDSGFSLGVFKVDDEAALRERLDELFERSDLLVAQEFVPTGFDWRVGIIDHQPLFVCRYGMAKGHWQIIQHDAAGNPTNGWYETLAVEDAPAEVVRTALRAARPIGDGLYGVDLKEVRGRTYVIEVNDNPNIETEVEDQVLGQALYGRVMDVFLRRLQRGKTAEARPATTAVALRRELVPA